MNKEEIEEAYGEAKKDFKLAYILITVKPMEDHSVYAELFKNPVIDEVYTIFGEWDLIIKITAENRYQLAKQIVENVNNVNGILSTKTLLG